METNDNTEKLQHNKKSNEAERMFLYESSFVKLCMDDLITLSNDPAATEKQIEKGKKEVVDELAKLLKCFDKHKELFENKLKLVETEAERLETLEQMELLEHHRFEIIVGITKLI